MIAQRTQADMLAYADNCLEEGERAAFEERMRREPDIKRQIIVWQAQNAALRAAYVEPRAPAQPVRPKPARDAPSAAQPARKMRGELELRGRLFEPKADPRPTRWRLPRLAKLAAFAAALGLAFWPPNEAPATAPSARAALASFRVYADDKAPTADYVGQDMRALRRALAGRLGVIALPDLATGDWILTAGRVVPGLGGPAALVSLENRRREAAIVLIDPSGEADAARRGVETIDGVNVASWAGAGQRISLASRAPLASLVQALYAAEPLPPGP